MNCSGPATLMMGSTGRVIQRTPGVNCRDRTGWRLSTFWGGFCTLIIQSSLNGLLIISAICSGV